MSDLAPDTASGVLADLPAPGRRRLAVRLTPDATRQVRGGHPWVYESAIRSVSHDGAAGDLAVVFDADRRFVAIGLWDPQSPIAIRVLHRGKPATIDGDWWAERIDAALRRRQPLIDAADTNGYRCIHGENDGFPGLVVDRYDSTLVVKLYTTAWIPHLRDMVPRLQARTQVDAIVTRTSRLLQRDHSAGLADGTALYGQPPAAPVPFLENGLRFEAAVIAGHKTGHFLDQRDNRARVRTMARGARVLDVFSYTGAFSLYAAAGGARSVVSVDQSTAALASATRTFEHNRDDPAIAAARHTTIAGDAFAVMRDLARRGERYDVVVVDPPSFTAKAADVDRARHAYGDLAQLASRLLEPGGLLVQASCSARVTADDFFATIQEAVRDGGRRLDEVERTGHAIDHPIGFPEGAYLKALFARVR
jgi:23S rRNA (cytosine1962-C5)-methyltransferase